MPVRTVIIRVAAGVGVGLGLLLAAVVVLLATLHPNDFVEHFAAQVSSELGRKVEIRGGLHGSLFSFDPKIEARDVRVANLGTGTEPDMMSIASVRIHFELLSLLGRRIVVHKIEVRSPKIFLEVDRDGRRNWAFLQKASDEPESGDEIPAVGLLEITNITLKYRDRKLGDAFDITIPKVVQSTLSIDDPLKVDLQFKTDLGEAKLVAKASSLLSLASSRPTPVAFEGTVGRNDIKGRLTVRIGRTVSVLGRMSSTVIDLVSRPPALSSPTKETQRKRRTLWRRLLPSLRPKRPVERMPKRKRPPAGEIAARPSIRPIRPKPVARAALRVPRALLIGVEANVAYSAKLFRTELGPLAGLTGRMTVKDSVITLQVGRARLGSARFAGRFALGPDGSLTTSSSVYYRPGVLRSTVRVANLYDLVEGRASGIRFSLAQGASDISGNLSVRYIQKLFVFGSVWSRSLDFRGPARQTNRTAFGLSNERIPAELLRKVSGRLNVSVQQVRVPGIEISSGRLIAEVKDGVLRISRLNARSIGGALTGSLAINGARRQPYLFGNILLSRADLRRALGANTHPTRVPFHTAIRLNGPLTSLQNLASNVSGEFMLLVAPDKPQADLGPVGDMLSGLANSLANIGRITGGPLKCVVMHLHFRNGVGRSKLMVIDTQGLSLHGQGTVDLRRDRVNMTFGAWPKLAIIRRFTPFVVRVSGSVSDPRIRLDVGAGAKEAIERLGGLVVLPFKLLGWALGAKPNLEARTEPCPAAIAAIERAYYYRQTAP